MLPTQRLENAVTRLTPEQYARVVAFAEALAAQTFEQTAAAWPGVGPRRCAGVSAS